MKETWTEKEMEILKEGYPIKEFQISKIDNRLLERAKEIMPTSRKAKLNGKLEYDANDDTKYIKAYLPDAYQIPSFELYLEIEINKICDDEWAYSVNLVRSGEIFKFPIRIGSGEACVTEECVVNYVLSELENEEVDWAAEIQIYDSFVEYAMTYFDRVYDIKRD